MQTKGFLGIDVSKGYADFLLLDSSKEILEAGFQLPDNQQGHTQLKALITKWCGEGLEELYCGVESTGGYENNWYRVLTAVKTTANVQVARLNAKAVKSVSEAALKRTITDGVSAENIAVYLLGFPEKIWPLQRKADRSDDRFARSRQQYTCIRMLQKQKVQLCNQLEKLLYQHFIELIPYCRHGLPMWLLLMLQKYPSAAAVNKAGAAKLSAIKGISLKKAQALLSKTLQPTQTVSGQSEHVIAVTAKELVHKTLLLKEEKQYLEGLHKDDEQVKLLCSIKGIGTEAAILILLEIEDISRFASAKKLASYFGVHPVFKQSGDGLWGNHMSKKGRADLRAILYMAAFSGFRCNPTLKKLYAKCRAKGMKHFQAMGVLMHKLLRIIYGVLTTQKPYDDAINESNLQRATEKQREKEKQQQLENKTLEKKKHRYQTLKADAPISRHAAQKLKKQTVSQT